MGDNRFSRKLMDIPTAAEYLSLGVGKTRSFAAECGAIRKIGSRVLVDRTVLDKALDARGGE